MSHHTNMSLFSLGLTYDKIDTQGIFNLVHHKHSLRLCSCFLHMYSSEILLLHNDPFSANQWTEFYLIGHEIVKNCGNLKWRKRLFPAYSFCLMLLKCCEYIPKSLSFALLSGVELILFMLRISPGQFGLKAYGQQKQFRNNMYLESVNMV